MINTRIERPTVGVLSLQKIDPKKLSTVEKVSPFSEGTNYVGSSTLNAFKQSAITFDFLFYLISWFFYSVVYLQYELFVVCAFHQYVPIQWFVFKLRRGIAWFMTPRKTTLEFPAWNL